MKGACTCAKEKRKDRKIEGKPKKERIRNLKN